LTDLRQVRKVADDLLSGLEEDELGWAFLSEQRSALQKVLDDSATPEQYKVVVGSLKVEKPSFMGPPAPQPSSQRRPTVRRVAAVNRTRWAIRWPTTQTIPERSQIRGTRPRRSRGTRRPRKKSLSGVL
jgi:hypothetical protein